MLKLERCMLEQREEPEDIKLVGRNAEEHKMEVERIKVGLGRKGTLLFHFVQDYLVVVLRSLMRHVRCELGFR